MLLLLDRLLLLVWAICAVLSVILTIRDKRLSKLRGRRRIPERTLLLLAFFGAALPEFLVMLLIRHKTRHKKFMLGLPAICVLHLAIAVLAAWI